MNNTNVTMTEFRDDFQSSRENAPVINNLGDYCVSTTSMPSIPSPGGETPVTPPFSGYVRIYLRRFGFSQNTTCSTYKIYVYNKDGSLVDFQEGYMLERGYNETEASVENSKTAIPLGTYQVVPSTFKQRSGYFEVCDVPGRTDIKIHGGSNYTHTTGCLLPGLSFKFVNDEYEIERGWDTFYQFAAKYINDTNTLLYVNSIHDNSCPCEPPH